MKANNLAVCVPNAGCNKHCPYCVSKMTGYTRSNWELMNSRIDKVVRFAERCGVSSVLLTGKGEPLVTPSLILILLRAFKDFPCELQTNGIALLDDDTEYMKERVQTFATCGLNTLAISCDRVTDINKFGKVFWIAKECGIVTRVTLNTTDMLPNDLSWTQLIRLCKEYSVQQISLRRITIPTDVKVIEPATTVKTGEINRAALWIRHHNGDELFEKLTRKINLPTMWAQDETIATPRRIRALPYGATVYDCEGIAIATFDYCVQDECGEEDIRSLIFQEDGHLYTAWNSPASLIF